MNMKLYHGSVYKNRKGEAHTIKFRIEDHGTVWNFENAGGMVFAEDASMYLGDEFEELTTCLHLHQPVLPDDILEDVNKLLTVKAFSVIEDTCEAKIEEQRAAGNVEGAFIYYSILREKSLDAKWLCCHHLLAGHHTAYAQRIGDWLQRVNQT